jgi:hypothetical protein
MERAIKRKEHDWKKKVIKVLNVRNQIKNLMEGNFL